MFLRHVPTNAIYITVHLNRYYSEECAPEKYFSYFSTKRYVMGTQKNHLNETVLLSTQNICKKIWVRKYLLFYAENVCLSKPMFIVNLSDFEKIFSRRARLVDIVVSRNKF